MTQSSPLSETGVESWLIGPAPHTENMRYYWGGDGALVKAPAKEVHVGGPGPSRLEGGYSWQIAYARSTIAI